MNSPSEKNNLEPGEQELEQGLAHLLPAQISLDPQAIFAISTSRRESRRLWFWRATSAALAACLVVAIWAKWPARSTPHERIVYVHDEQPMLPQPTGTPSALVLFPDPDRQPILADSDNENYLEVRQNVLRRGLRALTPIHLPTGSGSSRPSAPLDTTSSIDRAIEPPTIGPVHQFFDLLNKGSQL